MNRVSELVKKYGDWRLGAIDASAVAVAESLNLTDIATLAHEHFRAMRPRHVEAFTIQTEPLRHAPKEAANLPTEKPVPVKSCTCVRESASRSKN
jgi:hypothetical protein